MDGKKLNNPLDQWQSTLVLDMREDVALRKMLKYFLENAPNNRYTDHLKEKAMVIIARLDGK